MNPIRPHAVGLVGGVALSWSKSDADLGSVESANLDVAGMTITPFGRLDSLKLDVDGFTEREDKEGMGLTVGDHDTESLQSAIGGRVARHANGPFNERFTITSAEPDRDCFTRSLGASADFPTDWPLSSISTPPSVSPRPAATPSPSADPSSSEPARGQARPGSTGDAPPAERSSLIEPATALLRPMPAHGATTRRSSWRLPASMPL